MIGFFFVIVSILDANFLSLEFKFELDLLNKNLNLFSSLNFAMDICGNFDKLRLFLKCASFYGAIYLDII